MTYPYGRAVPLDGPRATITAAERDNYLRDVQVLLNRGGPMYYNPKPFGAWHPTWPNPSNFNHDTAEASKANLEKVYGPNSGHVVVEFRIVPVDTVYVVGDAEPWKEDA